MQRTIFPLHPAQEDVYTDQLINIKSPHYNIGGYIRLKGSLNKEKFHQAVNAAPLVFDVFKMRFDLNEIASVYHFDREFDKLDLPELDFSERIDPQGEAQRWVQDRFNTPFVIENTSLLFEHCLIKISADEHWFFCRYHHLITDGYGFIIFISYVARKYHSLIVNDELPFSYPPYYDEAIKARQYKNSPDYASDGEYWLGKLNQKPQKFLQKKYDSSYNSTEKGSTYILSLNKDERVLLDDIQRVTNSGLHQLTIAALLIYFGKTTGQSDFVFGIPVHKRGSKQLRKIFGMFSGILPHKVSYQRDNKLIDLLKDIAQSQRRDYRHHNYQIGDLSRSLKINSSEGYLCDVIINYELLDFELLFDEQIEATVLQVSSEYQENPLQISWRDFGDQQPLQLHIQFRNDYFSREEVALLAKRIAFIMHQFPGALNGNIDSIDILPFDERRLLDGFNKRSVPYLANKNIVDLFEEQVLLTPEAVAVVFEEQRFSYSELNERSNQLAHYLKGRGVEKQTLVPLCIERSLEMLVTILGILKAGCAYVPIDPAYPEERIGYMLEDTRASVVITSKETRTKLQWQEALDSIDVNLDLPAISNERKDNPQNRIAPDQLLYIIYTSGSTGKPKGVMIEHKAVVNLVMAQSKFFDITCNDKILQFSNYCFDASVEQIFLALLNGASLVLFREGLQLNTDVFKEFLIEKKISHLHATPFFLENLGDVNARFLRRVIAGGDICKRQLSAKWKNRVNFYNEYGPTETTVTSVEYKDQNNNSGEGISVPIGKPLANNYAYILHNYEQLCPVGVAGELCLGGAQVARGYLNLADLTAEKFVPDPFSKEQGARMYKTGDICRWLPDGNIEYLERIDDQVKIRGYRIELGEIENVLRQSDLISQAVVLAQKDKEGNRRLVGYIIPNGIFNKDGIRSYLRHRLPEFMIPVLWVELERLPLNVNGKVDKKALPDPDINDLLHNDYVAPRNEIEAELAVIWRELLEVEKVGMHDNFFELGGHSLKAIQLISRLNKRFNIKTDIKKIFTHPTISELCQVLPFENESEFTGIKQLPEQESYELSHSQKRIWVLSHFHDGSLAYSVPIAFVLEGNLNVAALKHAFKIVIERHEILRTVFIEVNGEPRQKILPSSAVAFVIEEIDLRGNVHIETTIKKSIEKESVQAFDLTKGPLLRATLYHETDEKYILVFNIHHIISDGWSKGILIEEILFFYKDYGSGVDAALPPLPTQYKEYAAWQEGSSSAQGDYWRKLYENGIPVLNFPLNFERPKSLSFSGAMTHACLDEALTLNLQKMAIQNKMTLNNLLLSIYGLLVAKYSQQDEVVIGSLTSGRSHVDLETLVGVFINFLPIKLSLKGSLKLTEYLKNSQDSLADAYSNQDYPFDLMVNDLIKERDASRNPFFDTMVNFHWENDLKEGVRMTGSQLSGTGLHLKPFHLTEEDFFHSVLDFKLDIEPIGGRLELYFSYNSRLFTREHMSDFLAEFVELLVSVETEPDKYLSEYFNMPAVKEEVFAPSHPASFPNLSVIICSSFVAEPLQEYLEYWSKEFNFHINITFSPYNQVFQQLLDPDSILNRNKGLNILFIRVEDWLHDKRSRSPSEQIFFLDQTYLELIKAIDHSRNYTFTPILAGIVPLLSSKLFNGEVAAHISQLNNNLESLLKAKHGFYLLDMNEIASLYLVDEVYDTTSDKLGHMPFTQEYYAALGTFISRKIRAYIGKSYKVLAVDCDNTLWKGVCGELGAMGIDINKNFSYLQKFLIEKYNEGFLLALCSKNNEEDVWEVFQRNPGMLLRPEHIAAHRINWNNKHENLVAIANELNVGLDSIVFLDDSEFEVEQLSLLCPEVYAFALPEDTDSFFSVLNHIWALDHFQTTEEDWRRNTMYKAEKLRKKEQASYHLLNDFLQTLNLEMDLWPLEEKDLQRASQLSLRTNQFNMNGIRRSAEDIAELINDHNSLNRIVEVKDRFGDYGIVGLLLARRTPAALIIESFMLSCRVLGRNVEDSVLSELQSYCVKHSLDTIEAQYKPTDKNKPFAEFLRRTNWIKDKATNTFRLLLNDTSQELSIPNNLKQPVR